MSNKIEIYIKSKDEYKTWNYSTPGKARLTDLIGVTSK